MADNRLSRQQIYDRIRESSKEEYILDEMKRLGFWARNQHEPSVPELLIRRQTTLSKELDKLLTEKRKYSNKEALLKEMRVKRMEEARRKRQEHKERKMLERYEKAQAWQRRKEQEIVYLGEGVSAGLHETTGNDALLQQHGLPLLANEKELSAMLGVSISELRFLSFSRKVSTVSHYRKFFLPKKSGGKRLIAAPMPRLKKTQYKILELILSKVALHTAAHGFVPARSIVSNAQQHVGKAVVINVDVKDFFPTIHFARVKGVFMALGYAEKIAVILALLCTEPITEEVEVDGRDYFVQKGSRLLPQGAPTSPAITNIICYGLDKRLQGIADKYQYAYTRYADDITFSGSEATLGAQPLLWRIRKILQEEGFTIHPDKIRVMRKGARQEVTGIVVNEKPGICREKLRRFRALLHQVRTKGYEGAHWGNGNVTDTIFGFLNYIKMVDPARAKQFEQQVHAIFQDPALQQQLQAAKAQPEKKKAPIVEQTPPQSGTPPPPAGKEGEDGNWWTVV